MIETSIVGVKFDNADFEKRAYTSMNTAKKLDSTFSSLNGVGKASGGLAAVAKAAKSIDLSSIGDGAGTAQNKITALGVAAITTLSNLTNRVVNSALALGKSIILDPKKAGFDEYETKMKSIQTILANTSKYGTKLSTVQKGLKELNAYADKTIYNFADMTRNIGLFTNSGMQIKPAIATIKGFSNEAAASGTNAQAASGAAYQLSQALSAGAIKLMDWRSLTNAGMGNANMKEGLIQIAEAMGTLKSHGTSSAAVMKDFNGTLEKGWLTADVMTKYLGIMAESDAKANREKMKAIGLTDQQINKLIKQQATAENAATKVRTWTQLTDTLAESVGSSWSETFELIFGDFRGATKLFTMVSKVAGGALDYMGNRRNKMLKQWNKLGGRDAAVEALTNSLKAIERVIKPIAKAWEEVFPSKSGKRLADFSKFIRDITKGMVLSKGASKALHDGMVKFFSAIKGGLKPFGDFIKMVGNQIKSVFSSIDIVGAIKNSVSGLSGIFDGISFGSMDSIGGVFANLGTAIKAVGSAIMGFISKLSAGEAKIDGVKSKVEGITGGFKSMIPSLKGGQDEIGKTDKAVDKVGQKADDTIGNIENTAKSAGAGIGDAFSGMGDKLASVDPLQALGAINTAAIFGLAFKIINLIKASFEKADWTDLVEPITGAIGEVTNTLKTMQGSIKAGIIVKIAASIFMLSFALKTMSEIEPDRLQSAALGMGVAFSAIVASFAIIAKFNSATSVAKLIGISIALTILSLGFIGMAKAMKTLGGLDLNQMMVALVGLAAIMAVLKIMTKTIGENSAGLIKGSIGLVILSFAIGSLVGSLALLSAIPFNNLMQGSLALGIIMGVMVGFMIAANKFGSGLLASAGAMVLLAFAINLLLVPISALGLIPWPVLAQGIATIVLVLAGLVIASQQMQNSLAGAAAIVAIAFALNLLIIPIAALGAMPFAQVIQGLVALGITIAILVIAVNAIDKVVAGVAGLVALSVAMLILAGAISILAGIPIGGLLVALLGLALGLTLLIVAGAAAGPLAPGLLVLAGAILAIGIAVALAGAGVLMFSMGLYMFGPAAQSAVTGIAALATASTQFASSMPQMIALGAGLLSLAAGMAAAGIAAILLGAGLALIGVGMMLLGTFGTIGLIALQALVNAISGMVGQLPQIGLMSAGFLALGVALTAVGVGLTLTAAGGILFAVAMIAVAIGAALVAGSILLLKLAIDGLAPTVPTLSTASAAFSAFSLSLSTIVYNVNGASIAINNLKDSAVGITGAFSGMSASVSKSSGSFTALAAQGTKMIGLASTTQKASTDIVNSLNAMAGKIGNVAPFTGAVTKIVGALNQLSTRGTASIVKANAAIKGKLSAISGDAQRSATKIGTAILNGMVNGMKNSKRVSDAARRVALAALSAAKAALDSHSPSREFMKLGQYSGDGMVIGLDNSAKSVERSGSKLGNAALEAASKSVEDFNNLAFELGSAPVITPVVDLSNVVSGANSISRAFSGSPSIGVAMETTSAAMEDLKNVMESSQSESDQTVTGTTTVFNQYNNSPKSLSPLEIYRQTKSLVSQIK